MNDERSHLTPAAVALLAETAEQFNELRPHQGKWCFGKNANADLH
ncbi:MAG: hypothetical protein WBO09_23490 [Methylocystis silviterrae]